MKFSHRATGLPGGKPAEDRVVLVDGREVARVMRIDAGPQAGLWRWSSYWSPAEQGVIASLEEGLQAVKRSVTAEKIATIPAAHKKEKG